MLAPGSGATGTLQVPQSGFAVAPTGTALATLDATGGATSTGDAVLTVLTGAAGTGDAAFTGTADTGDAVDAVARPVSQPLTTGAGRGDGDAAILPAGGAGGAAASD